MKTSENALIHVFYDGQLGYYTSNMLNKLNANTIRTNIDMSRVNESVYNRLDQIFADAKNKYSRVEYEEPVFSLTVLKDGNTALLCTVDVNCVEVSGEYEYIMSDCINFIVLVK